MTETMKLLSIGNSFSMDAQRYLHEICEGLGKDVLCCNLYIGGCSLERHWNNVVNCTPDYGWQVNGRPIENNVSLQSKILTEKWDIITLQQASHFSGMPQTYVPYITNLADWLRAVCPGAKIYIQETWAYEIDATHGAFPNYHCSQEEMYSALRNSYEMASRLIDAPLIPVGDVIQYLRENTQEFNYRARGLTLNRDGFHLSFDYGRYAAALTWYTLLFADPQEDIRKENFVPKLDAPKEYAEENPDTPYVPNERLLQVIRDGVHHVLREKEAE